MNSKLSKKTINKIESLCEEGCAEVNQLLNKASKGENLPELSDFSRSEISHIIEELGQIMSVYETDDKNKADTIK